MRQPKIQPIFKTDNYITDEDHALLILGYLIRVCKGFVFDGASIPRMAWSILGYTPFHPKVILAALIHDWLYLTHQYPREVADMLFRIILIQNGVEEEKAHAMYLAVRSIGGLFWEHNEEDKMKIQHLHSIVDLKYLPFYKLPALV